MRHRRPGRAAGRVAVDRPAAAGRAGPGARRRLPAPAARRAVVRPRRRETERVRRDPAPGRRRAGQRASCSSSTTWRWSWRVCDYIYVLDFGAADLRRHAGRGARAARSCGPPTSAIGRPSAGRRELREARAGVTAGYGDTTVLRDVDLVRAARVGRRPARPERRRQDHAAAGGVGPPAPLGTAGSSSTATTDRPAWPARAGGRRACATSPRAAAIFPALTVRENLVLQSPAGRGERGHRPGRRRVPRPRRAARPDRRAR